MSLTLYFCREQFPRDKEKDTIDNNYENDEQQSMESDSVIDVTEDDSNEQYVEQDQSVEHQNNTSNTGKHLCTSILNITQLCQVVSF